MARRKGLGWGAGLELMFFFYLRKYFWVRSSQPPWWWRATGSRMFYPAGWRCQVLCLICTGSQKRPVRGDRVLWDWRHLGRSYCAAHPPSWVSVWSGLGQDHISGEEEVPTGGCSAAFRIIPPLDAGLSCCVHPGEACGPRQSWTWVEEVDHMVDNIGRRKRVVVAAPLDVVHHLFEGG